LVRHCTDCEVNCDGSQNLHIKFTFHIVTSCYDRRLELQLSKPFMFQNQWMNF